MIIDQAVLDVKVGAPFPTVEHYTPVPGS